jgi:hypothetical protein
MAWTSTVSASLSTRDTPGSCLRFVQSAFGAPAKHFDAKEAWEATEFKHADRDLPNVSCPVWFTWSGTVNGRFHDYGHVAVWSPESGKFLSSPLWWAAGVNSQWVDSLEDFTRILGPSCKYLGWSEDLNGLRIVAPQTRPKGVTMLLARMDDSGAVYLWNTSTGAYQGMDGTQFGVFSSALPIMHFKNAAQFDSLRVGFGETFTIPATDATSIVSALASTTVNTDALAAAIASKLGSTSGDIPASKAELIALIEANYPEGK